MAEKASDYYQNYLDRLCKIWPSSYGRLRDFLARSECACGGFCAKGICRCGEDRAPCECKNPGSKCFCTKPEFCKRCQTPEDCTHRVVQDTVWVYDIYPNRLEREEYHTKNIDHFEKLHRKLSCDKLKYSETEDKPQGESCDGDRHEQDNFEDEDLRYRLITVSHINPKVAKLLGSTYDIEVYFFNRHLPGTEPLSGKLISKLPSSIQVEFDELYESPREFSKYWGSRNGQDGHNLIGEAMDFNFLFGRTGWDYFPVTDKDFESSLQNLPLSSGFEIKDTPDLKNVFQFNMSHRISIYSKPPQHPRTAIIIFYPTLTLNYPKPKKGPTHGDESNSPEHYPDEKCPPDCTLIHFRATPSKTPNPSKLSELDENYDSGYGGDRFKQPFAISFDRAFRDHVKKHNDIRKEEREKEREKERERATCFIGDEEDGSEVIGGIRRTSYKADNASTKQREAGESILVHLFGAPLFNMVASNWARLIIRRSFDLDLLEWRPKHQVTSETINEIKSRRISIARHQKDLNASVEILHGLVLEEQGQKVSREELQKSNEKATGVLALSERESAWNRGRSNGLVTESADPDSWEKIYWDFFELKSQVDALEKRADKIHDGILGLISVTQSENSSRLSLIAGLFSIVLLPFSIVGSIYSAQLDTGGPSKHGKAFWRNVGITFAVACVVFAILGFCYSVLEKGFWQSIRIITLTWREYTNGDPTSPLPSPKRPAQEKAGNSDFAV